MNNEQKAAAIEKAAKEIYAQHPDRPCWIAPEHDEDFVKLFAYITRLGFDAGYAARDAEVTKLQAKLDKAMDYVNAEVVEGNQACYRLKKEIEGMK